VSTADFERVLYEMRDFPIFQNRMYDSVDAARSCPKGNICLVENSLTGLVYNREFRPQAMQYDKHYQNEQAVSSVFRDHLAAVAGIIQRVMRSGSIIEIGCGKGYFLELLRSLGLPATGFDPTYEGTNPAISRYSFDASVGVSSDGIVLRHVLEHIQDPVQFLTDLRNANGGAGRIYIEVPCFDWICQRRAWFDVFYEHVNYFRLGDFHRMFGSVIESGRLFGGQYLYVVAELGSLTIPRATPDPAPDFPQDFLDSLTANDRRTSQTPSAIWGGASKGVIFAFLRERIGRPVQLVIDINQAKQGKFLPATGLMVHSPDEALTMLPRGSTIYVMNSNYLDEIRGMSNNAYQYIGIDNE
jgi:SAM-dependent methyltransferase